MQSRGGAGGGNMPPVDPRQQTAQWSEATLLSALARVEGREPAEAELYRRFAGRVRMYGLRHLHDSDAAGDLVQDVLQLVLEKARKGAIRESDKLSSFVLGTCRMLVVNQRRRDHRRRRLLQQYAEPEEPKTFPHVPLEERQRLFACIAALDERQRAVIVLSFYAERTCSEIGEELGTSGGNARVLRHRALERLRQCVQSGKVHS